MAVQVLRIVSVSSSAEVSRAELDGDTVTYSGPEDGETIQAVVKQRMRSDGTTAAEAFRALRRTGWSNGYLMVPLDELG